MSLDPIDYDVAELRELARRRGDRYVEDGFLWPEPSEGFPPIDELAEFDRPQTWTGSHEERQKPYLDEVPDSRAASSLVDRWVERLVETAGFDGAVDALAYYRSMGWITDGVEADLQDYLLAAGNHPGGSLDDLDRDDHVDSLARIIALAQMGGGDRDAGDEGRDEDATDGKVTTSGDGGVGDGVVGDGVVGDGDGADGEGADGDGDDGEADGADAGGVEVEGANVDGARDDAEDVEDAGDAEDAEDVDGQRVKGESEDGADGDLDIPELDLRDPGDEGSPAGDGDADFG